MKINQIRIDFRMNKDIIVSLLCLLNLMFFISGLIDLGNFKQYFNEHGIKSPIFSLIPPDYKYELYYVFVFDVIFLLLNLGAVIGLLIKKSWGWYCSFIFFLIYGFKTIHPFFSMFFAWCSSPYLMFFDWRLLTAFVSFIILILFLFDRGILNIFKIEKKGKLIFCLFISVIVFTSYNEKSILIKEGSNVFY